MTDDQQMMRHALDLARVAIFRTSPNPRVGCVLVSKDGKVLGEGSTQKAGGPHAEVMALRDAQARGLGVAGATAYVTLEPCAHFGRTGPCSHALIEAGVARVVAAMLDPNPKVAGQGIAKLKQAGISVDIGLGELESRELNLGFLSRFIRKTPWVRLKTAASLDGVTALPNGVSQWITSPEARADGHVWRARACAILTGVGTVLADNPRLDVRGVDTERQPRLVIVDSALRTPVDAAVFQADREVLIYTCSEDQRLRAGLEARGAQVIQLPAAHARVDLASMLRDLAARDVNELHVEAGHTLNAALLLAGLLDEILLYQAPMLLGQGAGLFAVGPFTSLAQKIPLSIQSVEAVGPDLRILARIPGRDQF